MLDIFLDGTETSATVIEWAMSEMQESAVFFTTIKYVCYKNLDELVDNRSF
ncbi:hypothetical protein JCGZ_00778 [Jatropha curcas]|uniref:Uncharacterized protein n=1 Tax=Jatropha curcas TaxID=180498 RepID=A0A067KS20_JATCU|nr:hypothetical protein JCGZ_00778 [Jatropha curcas]